MFLPIDPLPHVLSLVQEARSRFAAATEQANPITIAIHPRPIVDHRPALASARTGADLLRAALTLPDAALTAPVRRALETAAADAAHGIDLLTATYVLPQDTSAAAGHFDGAATRLTLAEELIRAELSLVRTAPVGS